MARQKPSHNSAFIKGMNKDIAKPMLEANQYRHAENLRITNIEGEGNGALVNIKGNELAVTIPDLNSIIELELTSISAVTSSSLTAIHINVQLTSGTYSSAAISPDALDRSSSKAFNRSFVKLVNKTLTTGGDTFSSKGIRFFTSKSSTKIEVQSVKSGEKLLDAYISVIDTSITNKESNKVIVQDNDTKVKIIGSTNLRESVIFFTAPLSDSGYGQIWEMTYDEDSSTTSVELKYQRLVPFNINHPIEAVARYETEKIKRVYFTDFNDEVRTVNIGADLPGSEEPSLSVLNPSINFTRPIVADITIGSLQIGVHQYAYRLKSNEGAITKFSPFSDFIPLTSGNVSPTTYNTSSEQQEVTGKDIGQDSGKGVQLKIKNIDLEYDTIEIAHMYYAQRGVDPVVNIIEESFIPDNGELTITHSGSEDIISSSSAEVLSIASAFSKAKTLAVKDNTLFAANVVNDPVIDFQYNARAYRYNSSSVTYVDDPTANPWDNDISLDDKDAINPFNDVDAETSGAGAYMYQSDGTTLGGEGPNISYTFTTELGAYGESNAGGPGQPLLDTDGDPVFPAKVKTFTGNFAPDGSRQEVTWKNYKAPHFLAHLKGYTRGEVYRFGIVFFDDKGRPGFVNWIGDIKIPNGLTDSSDYRLVSNPAEVFDSFKTIGIKFTINNVPDGVSAYRIVRLQRTGKDKTILGTGAMFPVYNYWLSNDGDYTSGIASAQLPIERSFDPDSNPYLSSNTNYFLANGVYPGNWSGLTDFDWVNYDGNFSGGVDDDPLTDSIFGGRFVRNNNYHTIECPDFHFLGDPKLKDGDHLRYVGTAYNRIGSDPQNLKTSTSINIKDDGDIDSPLNGDQPYPSTYSAEDITNSTYDPFNKYFTLHSALGGAGDDQAEGEAPVNTVTSSPLIYSWIKYYPLYDLNNNTSLSTISSRKINLVETSSVGAGGDVQLGKFEFKNAFVGFSLTHDRAESARTANAGTTKTLGDDNTSFLKFNYSGIGNKTLAVQTSGFNSSASGYGGSSTTIPFTGFEINVESTSKGSTPKVVTVSASYQVNTEEVAGETPIVQYVRPLIDQYGGNTADARNSQIYIPCGDLIDVASRASNEHTVYGGDTIVGYYDVTKSERRPDGNGFRVGYTFPVESSVAFNLREGDHFMNQAYPGTGDEVYVEDDYILNSVYLFAMDAGIEKYFTAPLVAEEENKYDAMVYASNTKIDGETTDSWRQFDILRSLKVEGHAGPINKLISFKDEIFFLQDRGFGRLVINPRALAQTSQVGELQLGEGNVLDDFMYMTSEHGSEQQFSPIVTDAGIYFIDTAQKKLFQFGGQLTSISEGSINSYLQSTTLPEAFKNDNPFAHNGIISGWDKKYNEVLFTLHPGYTESQSLSSRSGTTFTFAANDTFMTKIKANETVQITDGTVTTLAVIKEVINNTSFSVYNSSDISDLDTTGLTVKYSKKDSIEAEIGKASGVFVSVDTKIVSDLSVGDWVEVTSSVSGTDYYKITAIPTETKLQHGSGWVAGDLTIKGYVQTSETLVYSEPASFFSGFYSCRPSVYFNINNYFLSLNPFNLNDIYLHDVNNYGLFYGSYYDSLLNFLANSAADVTKVFDNVSFQMEAYNSSGVQKKKAIDEIRFHTDYQNTDWITLDPDSSTPNLRRVEREWQLQIPRNAVVDSDADIFDDNNLDTAGTFKDRIRDKYLEINVKIKNDVSNIKKLLHYVKTFFRASAR